MSRAHRYAAFEVRTSCPHCGNPLILNGPLLQPECPSCQKIAELNPGLWKSILEDVVEEYDGLKNKQGYTGTLMTGGFSFSRGYWRLDPRCQECKTEIPVADVETGADQQLACPQCQTPMTTYPAPEWLREELPSAAQVFGGEREGGPSEAADGDESARPVVLGCPKCGGALEITASSPRLAPCQGCGSDVYLPDEVWHRFHPAATVQEWFIRFEGRAPDRPELEEPAEVESALATAGSFFDEAEGDRPTQEAEPTPRRAGRTQAQWEHFQAEESALAEREIERGADRAWMLTGVAILLWILLDLYLAYRIEIDFPVLAVLVPAVAISSAVALYSGMKLIKIRANTDWTLVLFETAFYVPFCLFPGLGVVFGLWVLFKMWRGRIGGSTITSTSGASVSSQSYGVMELKGAGLPAGLLILCYAASLQVVYARAFEMI